ncbi:MAG: hypothetical protein LH470_04330 [Lysobacter sp.]|nr:hypothetical protein [Lysobacter sp.]
MSVAHPDEFEETIDNQDAQGSNSNQQDANAPAESAGGRDSEANNPIIINK